MNQRALKSLPYDQSLVCFHHEFEWKSGCLCGWSLYGFTDTFKAPFKPICDHHSCHCFHLFVQKSPLKLFRWLYPRIWDPLKGNLMAAWIFFIEITKFLSAIAVIPLTVNKIASSGVFSPLYTTFPLYASFTVYKTWLGDDWLLCSVCFLNMGLYHIQATLSTEPFVPGVCRCCWSIWWLLCLYLMLGWRDTGRNNR